MNTKLDETILACWLEDELQGVELAAFEASIQGDADLLARRKEVRQWRRTLAATLPAVLEPPYPEFFNQRIERAIREQVPRPSLEPAQAPFWRAWWMPATALAGMVLAFWAGTLTGEAPPGVTRSVPAPVPVAEPVPSVYTPERGVDAEWFSSADAAATVIVLEGVEAIPDSLDFFETVGLRGNQEATAGLESTEDGEMRQ
jgi:hypothetical protein